MTRHVIFGLVAAAVLTSFTAAQAQDGQCAAQSAIVSLSDTVLAQRQALPRLHARSYGAEAAYLKLRYTPLEGEAAASFLTDLLDDDIRWLRELAFAWFVSTEGLARAEQELGDEGFGTAMLSSSTVFRALVLSGVEEVAINALAALPEADQAALTQPFYAAIIDQHDVVKARVAKLAEAKGLVPLAAALHATQRDTTAWQAFIGRIGDPALAADLTKQSELLPIFVGRPALRGVAHHDDGFWQKTYVVMGAGALQPELEFLMEFVNYTGMIDEAYAAAETLRTEIVRRNIALKGPLDAGWLFAYRALREAVADDGVVDDALRAMTRGKRHQRPTTADVLDWIIAVDALRAYVSGKTQAPPSAPEGPAGTLADNWQKWLEVAELVRTDPASAALAADELTLTMAAELLLAAGQFDALAGLLGTAPPSSATVANAADFAKRLDRGCQAYLWHVSEAMTQPGLPIYKFDSGRDVSTDTPADKLSN